MAYLEVENCGGKGGTPGPCPTGRGKRLGSGQAKSLSIDAERASRNAWEKESLSSHQHAAGSHRRAAEANRGAVRLEHEKKAARHEERVKHFSIAGKVMNMKLSQQERQGIIEHLTANCDAWRQPGDDQVLNNMTDEKLLALKEDSDKQQHVTAVANAAVNGFSDGETAFRINPETGKWERRVDNAKKKKAPPMDDDDEEDEEDDDMASNRTAPPADEPRRPRTVDDWFRNAPAEVQEERRAAQAIVNREKDAVISQLLANVSEADRQVHRERLQRRSLDELHYDLSLIPKTPTQEEINKAAGATHNRRRQQQSSGDGDMLEVPTMNWQEVDVPTGKHGQRQEAVDNLDADDDMTDEDWLKNAPLRIRQAVQNATAVEARERRRMIDSLVANFQGTEDQEKLFVQRMENKSLQELQDMLNLLPKRDNPRPNYFGQAAPLANQVRSADVGEDVLPLPKIDWKQAN